MFWYSFYSEDRRRMAKRSGTTVTRGQRRFQLFSGGRSDAGGQKMDYYDYNLLAAVILLTCFGLVMLYSVSAYSSYVNFGQNDMYFFERQAGIAFAAFVFLLIVSRLDYHLVTRHAFLIYVIANALLVATRFVGRTINGARRWIYIGPVSFQPAELEKMLMFGAVILVVGLIFVLILKNRISMDAQSSSFRIQRIITWLNPEETSDEGGYQVMQALYAIGSGGLFGKGLGNSAQKLGALPEAQNDMIFSIICEELGIVGAMIVLLLFVFVLYRLFAIAVNAPDLLGSLITIGIFAHIAIQVILNIAVVLNVIPTTGITLPFVSYGGTSIVFLMAEMALALSISGQIEGK